MQSHSTTKFTCITLTSAQCTFLLEVDKLPNDLNHIAFLWNTLSDTEQKEILGCGKTRMLGSRAWWNFYVPGELCSLFWANPKKLYSALLTALGVRALQ